MPLTRTEKKAPAPKSIKRTVEPEVLAVALLDVKQFLRVDTEADDDLIRGLIRSATARAEDYTRRAFVTQTWEQYFDSIPFSMFTIPEVPRIIEVPRPPVQSVSSIKYYEEDDTEQTYALTNVYIDVVSSPARITLREGASWPSGLRLINAVKITWVTGYGDADTDVPDAIREAIKRMVALEYVAREDCGQMTGGIHGIAKAMLDPFKVFYL